MEKGLCAMCENPVTRVHEGLPAGYVLQRGPAPEYRWFAMRLAPTEYCLPDPDSPGSELSFATLAEGQAWFAERFNARDEAQPLAGATSG
jgi:hypothetical protein